MWQFWESGFSPHYPEFVVCCFDDFSRLFLVSIDSLFYVGTEVCISLAECSGDVLTVTLNAWSRIKKKERRKRMLSQSLQIYSFGTIYPIQLALSSLPACVSESLGSFQAILGFSFLGICIVFLI